MKTHLKSKIAMLIISIGLFSCKGTNQGNSQDRSVNGSEKTTDSTTTTTKDNFNTDGTTVAPGASKINSGTSGSGTMTGTGTTVDTTGTGTKGSGTNGTRTNGSGTNTNESGSK